MNSFMEYRKRYQKDIIFAAVVLFAAVILLGILWRQRSTAAGGGYIEITIDGELYGSYPLNQAQEIVVESPYGTNTVVIKEGRAFVTEADCPDKICAAMQPVFRNGETICCLPHHLFIEAYGKEQGGYDAVAGG